MPLIPYMVLKEVIIPTYVQSFVSLTELQSFTPDQFCFQDGFEFSYCSPTHLPVL